MAFNSIYISRSISLIMSQGIRSLNVILMFHSIRVLFITLQDVIPFIKYYSLCLLQLAGFLTLPNKKNTFQINLQKNIVFRKSTRKNYSLTGMYNIDFDATDPWRKDSQTICPSGRFHALNMLPSEERVMTSEAFKRKLNEFDHQCKLNI